MNRYGAGGASKATASTLCQKCLKRDIYECKAVAQERPYVPRPSRTQQLFNPKLVPKLTSDTPLDILKKKGVADEQLARLESEGAGKGITGDENFESPKLQNRSRAGSSCSSSSVSTISTNASKSSLSIQGGSVQRPSHRRRERPILAVADRKRRRSASSEDYPDPPDLAPNRRDSDVESSRSTRRKIFGLSPSARGRRRSRSNSIDRRSSYSNESYTRMKTEPRRWTEERERSPHRPYAEGTDRRQYISSLDRSARQHGPLKSHERRDSFQNEDKSPQRNARDRVRRPFDDEDNRGRGLDTAPPRQGDGNIMANSYGHNANFSRDRPQVNSSKVHEGKRGRATEASPLGGRIRREKSLSPFSKRLALTQAMNMGR